MEIYFQVKFSSSAYLPFEYYHRDRRRKDRLNAGAPQVSGHCQELASAYCADYFPLVFSPQLNRALSLTCSQELKYHALVRKLYYYGKDCSH